MPHPAPGRGTSLKLVGGVGGVVVALGIGGFAAVQLLGGSGGADSPEQAVTELVAAVNAQDPIATADLLNPAETEGLGEVVGDLRKRLASEGLTPAEGRLTDAATLQIDGLDLSTREVGDGIVKVRIEGADVSSSYDPAELPEDLVPEGGAGDPESWSGDIAREYEEEFGFLPSITTVEVDGRWYVSPVATVLDLYIDDWNQWGDSPIPSPDYDAYADGDDVEPVVGDTVRDAAENTAEAASSEDLDALLATLPEGQADLLRPYVASLQSLLRRENVSFTAALEGLEGEESEEGDLRRLVISSATASAYGEEDGDGESAYAYVQGSCAGVEDEEGYDSASMCLEDEVERWTGIREISVMARKVGGGWQIDPVATVMDYAAQAVDGLDVDGITRAIREEW